MCDVTTKMAAPIEQWTNIEVRGVKRFLLAKGNNQTEIHHELVAVYGEHVMSRKQVCGKVAQ